MSRHSDERRMSCRSEKDKLNCHSEERSDEESAFSPHAFAKKKIPRWRSG
jgi:hypothetical protein